MLESHSGPSAASREADEGDFNCRLCGHCCEGRGGIVVSDADLSRLCEFLAMSAESFAQDWGVRQGGKLFIRSDDSGCVFFHKGKGCSVHAAKPDICRAWPYFRGNLVDRESHALAKEYCPGIPQTQTHEEFVRRGVAYLVHENLAGSAGPDEAAALQVSDLLESLAHNAGKR